MKGHFFLSFSLPPFSLLSPFSLFALISTSLLFSQTKELWDVTATCSPFLNTARHQLVPRYNGEDSSVDVIDCPHRVRLALGESVLLKNKKSFSGDKSVIGSAMPIKAIIFRERRLPDDGGKPIVATRLRVLVELTPLYICTYHHLHY